VEKNWDFLPILLLINFEDIMLYICTEDVLMLNSDNRTFTQGKIYNFEEDEEGLQTKNDNGTLHHWYKDGIFKQYFKVYVEPPPLPYKPNEINIIDLI